MCAEPAAGPARGPHRGPGGGAAGHRDQPPPPHHPPHRRQPAQGAVQVQEVGRVVCITITITMPDAKVLLGALCVLGGGAGAAGHRLVPDPHLMTASAETR